MSLQFMQDISNQPNQSVLDFQLVYDTDSNIQLDLYADGLLEEPKLVSLPCPFRKRTYGLLSADLEDFNTYQEQFISRITQMQETLTTGMVQSIVKVHQMCRRIEHSLDKGTSFLSDKALWSDFYKAIIKMMSFKRISDEYQLEYEHLATVVTLPSYMDRLYSSLHNLHNNLSSERILHFIRYTGFLLTFNIEKTELESEETVRMWANRSWEKKSSLRRCAPKTQEEQWIKRVGWYEEMRHYYQLRALRNFRLLFEREGIPVHEGTWEHLNSIPSVPSPYVCSVPLADTHIYGKGNFSKFQHLAVLSQNGIRVPSSYLLTALEETEQAWQTMKTHIPLAVRSSMQGEDGENKSYAGHFETILGVNSYEEFQEAVHSVWDSANKMTPGILIQPMIRSRISGVLFTSSPFDASSMTIESIYGLGEPLVSGQIIPDRFTINRTSGTIEQQTLSMHKHFGLFIHDKASVGEELLEYGNVRYSAGNTVKCVASIPYSMRSSLSLTTEEIHTLYQTALSIEELFGCPQDIEWAWDRHGLVILQTRPITVRNTETKVRTETEHSIKGTIASTGEITGIVLEASDITAIQKAIATKTPYIIVARETSPNMIYELSHASGIITEIGSVLCHAAIVSREWNIPCLVGVSQAVELLKNKQVTLRSFPSVSELQIGEVIVC